MGYGRVLGRLGGKGALRLEAARKCGGRSCENAAVDPWHDLKMSLSINKIYLVFFSFFVLFLSLSSAVEAFLDVFISFTFLSGLPDLDLLFFGPILAAVWLYKPSHQGSNCDFSKPI